jgi:hypothetical protein
MRPLVRASAPISACTRTARPGRGAAPSCPIGVCVAVPRACVCILFCVSNARLRQPRGVNVQIVQALPFFSTGSCTCPKECILSGCPNRHSYPCCPPLPEPGVLTAMLKHWPASVLSPDPLLPPPEEAPQKPAAIDWSKTETESLPPNSGAGAAQSTASDGAQLTNVRTQTDLSDFTLVNAGGVKGPVGAAVPSDTLTSDPFASKLAAMEANASAANATQSTQHSEGSRSPYIRYRSAFEQGKRVKVPEVSKRERPPRALHS